jgi:hypothetical protein
MSSVRQPEATDRLPSDPQNGGDGGDGHPPDPRVVAAMEDVAARAHARPPQSRAFKIGLVVGLFVLCVIAARGCQQSQIRITKEQAIASAERRVAFKPTRVQVRLVRQGLTSRPFWAVSLSIPSAGTPGVFDQLAVIRVSANTGKVEEVRIQRNAPKPGGG